MWCDAYIIGNRDRAGHSLPEQYGTLVWALDQSGYHTQYYTCYHKQSHIPPKNRQGLVF